MQSKAKKKKKSNNEFEQTPGDGEGQRNLACYCPRSHRVGHDLATEKQQIKERSHQNFVLKNVTA